MEQKYKRVALVTGANKGIGREIARQLGRADVTVILGARDLDRGREAADALRNEGLDAHSLQLDVTDSASVQDAVASIATRFARLDIVVNNAGIADAQDGPPTSASIDGARRLLETNFLGALAVTQAVLPLLRTSPAGRIVNMSSALGSLTMNGDPASPYYAARLIGYNASKAALNMLTVQLAQELRDTPIIVNSACPGFVKTDLNGNTGHLSPSEAAATPVRLALLHNERPTGSFLNSEGVVPW